MTNIYTASALTHENGELTLTVEGVSTKYLNGNKLVALFEMSGKNVFMFRAKDRKRTNISIDAANGDRESWFQLIGADRINLKDYAGEMTEAEVLNTCYRLTETVSKTVKALNESEAGSAEKETLKEDLRLGAMKRRAGFVK